MTHAADPCCPPPDFSAMTAEEIIAYFDRYEFRDPLGHPLTQCQDFIDMVETVVQVGVMNRNLLQLGDKP